jgi:hypothetical protein
MDFIKANKEQATKSGFDAKNFVVADLKGWDYKDTEGKAINGIDIILVWNTLCFFNLDEGQEILMAAKQRLSLDGHLIVCEPEGTGGVRKKDRCIYRKPGDYEDMFKKGYTKHGHICFTEKVFTDPKDNQSYTIPKSTAWVLKPKKEILAGQQSRSGSKSITI